MLCELRCPITQEPLQDPVLAADGNTYERAAIQGGWVGGWALGIARECLQVVWMALVS